MKIERPEACNGSTIVFFALARNAMYAACVALGIKKNDDILTPAFDCDGALQPFTTIGCNLRFYRSDAFTFEADINDIKSKITPETKLIHVINHFGFPQPWKELLKLRKETGIPILEDNAYSLFSRYEGKRFGEFGDIAVFSLRKNLPLIDGGILKINNTGYKFTLPRKSARLFYPTENGQVLNIFKRWLGWYRVPWHLRRLVVTHKRGYLVPPPLYSESDEFPRWPLRDVIGKEFSCDYLRPMSRLAQWQLGRISDAALEEMCDRKRYYYCLFLEKIAQVKGIRVLWPRLPEGIVPFCNFLLIGRKRDVFYEELSKGYEVLAWPTLPQQVLDRLDDFPEVKLLGKQLLQINLPSDRVRMPSFQAYLNNLAKGIALLAKRNL